MAVPSPAVTRFLTMLSRDLASSFSDAQLRAIDLHFGMRHRSHHTIDWRWRAGFARLRLYVVILVGRDRNTT